MQRPPAVRSVHAGHIHARIDQLPHCTEPPAIASNPQCGLSSLRPRIHIRTRVDHSRLTYQTNGLRDCLYASSLTRRLESDWFADKDGEREIDRRP